MDQDEEQEMARVIHSLAPEKVYAIGRKAGLKEGVWRFAWWKDGEQQVGTTGKTLKAALADIDAEA